MNIGAADGDGPPSHTPGESRANGSPSTAAGVAPGQDGSRGQSQRAVAQAGCFTDKSFPTAVTRSSQRLKRSQLGRFGGKARAFDSAFR